MPWSTEEELREDFIRSYMRWINGYQAEAPSGLDFPELPAAEREQLSEQARERVARTYGPGWPD